MFKYEELDIKRELYSLEVVLNSGHAEVAALVNDLTAELKGEVATAFWDRGVRDLPVYVLDVAGSAHSVLIPWEVPVEQGDLARGDQSDIHAVGGLHLLEELVEGLGTLNHDLVIDGVALGDGLDLAHEDRVVLLRLSLVGGSRLREDEERKGEVDEAILVGIEVIVALDKFVHLSSNAASDHGGCGSDGRDDLSSNHLGLLLVALVDSVVASAEVGSSMNEVDVEVGVIILFELDGMEILASDSDVVDLELSEKCLQGVLILRSSGLRLCLCLLAGSLPWELDLDGLGLEGLDGGGSSGVTDGVGVSALSDAKIVSNQVGGSCNEMHVKGVLRVEPLSIGSTLGARPEGVSVRIDVILGEDVKKVEDLVIEEGLEVLAGNIHASLELGRLLKVDQLLDLLHGLAHTGNGGILLQLSNEGLRLLDVASCIVGAVNE